MVDHVFRAKDGTYVFVTHNSKIEWTRSVNNAYRASKDAGHSDNIDGKHGDWIIPEFEAIAMTPDFTLEELEEAKQFIEGSAK